MSAFVAASRFAYPSMFARPSRACNSFAAFCAFAASREPIKTRTPACAKRAASALPSLPVPPMMARVMRGFGDSVIRLLGIALLFLFAVDICVQFRGESLEIAHHFVKFFF